jgi:hypothetical protein
MEHAAGFAAVSGAENQRMSLQRVRRDRHEVPRELEDVAAPALGDADPVVRNGRRTVDRPHSAATLTSSEHLHKPPNSNQPNVRGLRGLLSA